MPRKMTRPNTSSVITDSESTGRRKTYHACNLLRSMSLFIHSGFEGAGANARFHLHLGILLRANATVGRDRACSATGVDACRRLSVGRTGLCPDQLGRPVRERQLAVRYRTR